MLQSLRRGCKLVDMVVTAGLLGPAGRVSLPGPSGNAVFGSRLFRKPVGPGPSGGESGGVQGIHMGQRSACAEQVCSMRASQLRTHHNLRILSAARLGQKPLAPRNPNTTCFDSGGGSGGGAGALRGYSGGSGGGSGRSGAAGLWAAYTALLAKKPVG